MKALLKHFRPMPVEVLARRELEEAQRELLEAETGMDFARAMVAYHTDRIERLKGTLNGLELRDQAKAKTNPRSIEFVDPRT